MSQQDLFLERAAESSFYTILKPLETLTRAMLALTLHTPTWWNNEQKTQLSESLNIANLENLMWQSQELFHNITNNIFNSNQRSNLSSINFVFVRDSKNGHFKNNIENNNGMEMVDSEHSSFI